MQYLDQAAFDEHFEGMTVTLMAPRRLLRELALIRRAMPPGPSVRRPATMEECSAVAIELLDLLPPVPPSTLAARRAFPGSLRAFRNQSARAAILAATDLVAFAQQHAPLVLVPAVWPHRMYQLLSGQLYVAQVRCASAKAQLTDVQARAFDTRHPPTRGSWLDLDLATGVPPGPPLDDVARGPRADPKDPPEGTVSLGIRAAASRRAGAPPCPPNVPHLAHVARR